MTSSLAISKYFGEASSSSSSLGRTVQVVQESGSEFIRRAPGFGLGAICVGTGTAALVTSGFAKSLLPDNTAADKFSVFGMIVGGILAIYGLVKMWISGNKQEVSNNTSEAKYEVNLSDSEIDELSTTTATLSSINQDPVFSFSRDIVDVANNNRKVDAEKLYKLWTKDEGVCGFRGPGKIAFSSPKGGSASELTDDEYRDRLAVLIGYIMAGRSDDTFLTNITGTKLKYSDLIDPTKGCKFSHLLPHEFNLVYMAARNFKEVLKSDTNIQTIFQNVVSEVSVPGRDPESKLKNYVNAHNYLRILKCSIDYVFKAEEEQTLDNEKARKVVLVRSALITGLGLKGNKSQINAELRKILNGDAPEKSLVEKINKLAEYKVRDVVVNQLQAQGYGISDAKIVFEDIFPSSEGFIDLKTP
ncbi:MAG: hypothetical protein HYY52_07645 [Candidatus Melainabacteria bacterium]|nr:hypothetical protein [Candidatus Melainabacteria bacterium]